VKRKDNRIATRESAVIIPLSAEWQALADADGLSE
jgi:hypothetical protein